jgi:F-type H+-transporting ATPase subunit a
MFLANSPLYDTLLFPKTVIEILDEVIYRKNLELFADTLHLKHNHEVKHFQEFFVKVHGLLLFILIANVQGMVPFSSTITSSLVNTFYISAAVFFNIIYTLIKEKGVKYFLSLFLPAGCPFPLIFLLNPIEFISYIFRLVSLSVRLFANMMAGHTLMKVIAGFS